MVAKEGQNADAEHGCHKEKEQDVEFGVSFGQLVLGGRRGREQSGQPQIQADVIHRTTVKKREKAEEKVERRVLFLVTERLKPRW